MLDRLWSRRIYCPPSTFPLPSFNFFSLFIFVFLSTHHSVSSTVRLFPLYENGRIGSPEGRQISSDPVKVKAEATGLRQGGS
jgi:hypothetical protein